MHWRLGSPWPDACTWCRRRLLKGGEAVVEAIHFFITQSSYRGFIMERNTRFVHFRICDSITGEVQSTTGVTLAYREVDDGVEYAAAYCSPHDRYNKQIGRTIATARMLDDETCLVTEISLKEFEEICKGILGEYHDDYEMLLEDMEDQLGIDIPAAYLFYEADEYGYDELPAPVLNAPALTQIS
jgi:hypothetical protein